MKKILIALFTGVLLGCAVEQEAENSVRIVRDEYGVPHIYADDVYGLFYGYGYAIAEDRLFQMEMARRSTQGMVAEVLGEEYLAFDTSIRTNYLPDSIKRQLQALPTEDRDIFAGYAAGFNQWIKQVEAQPEKLLPKQFTDFGFRPQQWTDFDVAMIFVGTMANRFGDFNTEFENASMLAELVEMHGAAKAKEILDTLNPRFTDDAPTTVSLMDWPKQDQTAQGGEANLNQLAANVLSDAEPEVFNGFSNCFVLGPDKSEAGVPILVNGPQFGWFVPSYVYSVGLHGGGFDVVGNTPFGYPIILFGHNGDIAWGSTWGAGDIVDIYEETLHPEDPGQYVYGEGYLQIEERTEIIQVKGAEDVEVVARRTIHGPVVAEAQGVVYAKQRSWDGRELESLLAWVKSMQTDNFPDWLKEAEKVALNINWYYADTSGGIGYAYTGYYPDRVPSHDNRLPAKGDGTMEWLGRTSFAKNPKVHNPGSGYIANWNNKPGQGVPNPDEFWYSWSRADRVDYLADAIEAQAKFSADQAWNIIEGSSYADVNAPYFMDLIARSVGEDASAELLQAKKLLLDWDRHSRDTDNDGFYDEPQTLLFREFLGALISAVLADDLGEVFNYFADPGYPLPGKPTPSGMNVQAGTKAVVASLDGSSSYDFLNGVKAEQVIADTLKVVVQQLQASHGENLASWRLAVGTRPYRTSNFLGIPQTFEDESLSTPLEQNRGTENNMFIMHADRVIGWEVTPPGQSGFVAPDGSRHAHYNDQLDMYQEFGRKRTWFYADEVEANKKSELQLPVMR